MAGTGRQEAPAVWIDAVVAFVAERNAHGERPTKAEAGGTHRWLVDYLLAEGRLVNVSDNPSRYELEVPR